MAYVTVKKKDGRTRSMQARYAKILVGMGRAEYLTKPAEPAVKKEVSPEPAPNEDEVPKASAAAAELAEQHGIDLTDVDGTGAGGMITKPDVERLIQE